MKWIALVSTALISVAASASLSKTLVFSKSDTGMYAASVNEWQSGLLTGVLGMTPDVAEFFENLPNGLAQCDVEASFQGKQYTVFSVDQKSCAKPIK